MSENREMKPRTRGEWTMAISGPTGGRGPGNRRGSGSGRGRGGSSGGRGRGRGVARGDVRIAVLTLLTEEPMHGYQIITELADRTHGVWRPSPGSIYPLLQQLADEGLVVSTDDGGRNVFSLTDDGNTAATEQADGPPIWDRVAGEETAVDLRDTMGTVFSAARQVAKTGTPEQAAKAAEILTEARKRLYQLLAE